MAKHNFLKRELKLIAKLYAGSILIQTDCGFDPEEVGLTEKDADYILSQLHKMGTKLMEDEYVSSSSLEGIVKYVNDKYYE